MLIIKRKGVDTEPPPPPPEPVSAEEIMRALERPLRTEENNLLSCRHCGQHRWNAYFIYENTIDLELDPQESKFSHVEFRCANPECGRKATREEARYLEQTVQVSEFMEQQGLLPQPPDPEGGWRSDEVLDIPADMMEMLLAT